MLHAFTGELSDFDFPGSSSVFPEASVSHAFVLLQEDAESGHTASLEERVFPTLSGENNPCTSHMNKLMITNMDVARFNNSNVNTCPEYQR